MPSSSLKPNAPSSSVSIPLSKTLQSLNSLDSVIRSPPVPPSPIKPYTVFYKTPRIQEIFENEELLHQWSLQNKTFSYIYIGKPNQEPQPKDLIFSKEIPLSKRALLNMCHLLFFLNRTSINYLDSLFLEKEPITLYFYVSTNKEKKSAPPLIPSHLLPPSKYPRSHHKGQPSWLLREEQKVVGSRRHGQFFRKSRSPIRGGGNGKGNTNGKSNSKGNSKGNYNGNNTRDGNKSKPNMVEKREEREKREEPRESQKHKTGFLFESHHNKGHLLESLTSDTTLQFYERSLYCIRQNRIGLDVTKGSVIRFCNALPRYFTHYFIRKFFITSGTILMLHGLRRTSDVDIRITLFNLSDMKRMYSEMSPVVKPLEIDVSYVTETSQMIVDDPKRHFYFCGIKCELPEDILFYHYQHQVRDKKVKSKADVLIASYLLNLTVPIHFTKEEISLSQKKRIIQIYRYYYKINVTLEELDAMIDSHERKNRINNQLQLEENRAKIPKANASSKTIAVSKRKIEKLYQELLQHQKFAQDYTRIRIPWKS